MLVSSTTWRYASSPTKAFTGEIAASTAVLGLVDGLVLGDCDGDVLGLVLGLVDGLTLGLTLGDRMKAQSSSSSVGSQCTSIVGPTRSGSAEATPTNVFGSVTRSSSVSHAFDGPGS